MNKHYLLWKLQQTNTIVVYFHIEDYRIKALGSFLELLEQIGYTIESRRYIKARIAYTVRVIEDYSKVRTFQDFDIPEHGTWSDAWNTFNATKPSHIQLWNSRECEYLGCPELIGLYVEYKIVRRIIQE